MLLKTFSTRADQLHCLLKRTQLDFRVRKVARIVKERVQADMAAKLT